MPPTPEEPLDLSNVDLDSLIAIHNQVLRRVAAETKVKLDADLAAGHDSHGSNHSNNKITDRSIQDQISRIARGGTIGQ